MASNEKFVWTHHVEEKMRYYRLTESRIKRIIRHPTRTEEGILEGAVACMQPSEGKKYSEIWTMYVLVEDVTSRQFPPETRKNSPARNFSPRSVALFSAYGRKTMPGDGSSRCAGSSRVWPRPHEGLLRELPRPHRDLMGGAKRIKIITAWRYPGKSPARDPIPPEILREIKSLL